MGVEVFRGDPEIPVEKVEELFLHEVDFGDGEAEVFVSSYSGVPSPVLVLWRGVVEVLCGEDERGEEDAVDCTSHAFGYWR